MKFSMEVLVEIWNDEDGTRLEVGPDRDGLDLIEIRYRDEQGKIGERITMPKEQAKLVRDALTKLLEG